MKIIKEDQHLMVIKDRSIVTFFVGGIIALGGLVVVLKPDFFTNQPPMWSGFVGMLMGLFVVFVAKLTTVTLDKSMGKVVFKWKTLINEKLKEYDIGSIKQLELQQEYASNSKSGGYSYKLVFILNTGEEVYLNQYSSPYVTVNGIQIMTEKGIGTRIAHFLTVPFQERRQPTVGETLSTIQSAIQGSIEKEMEKRKKE